jgi:hypothetical protein
LFVQPLPELWEEPLMGRRIYRQRVIVGAPPQGFMMPECTAVMRTEATRMGVADNAPHAVDFWYEHDDEAREVDRTFLVLGTGHEVPGGAFHQGSTARTQDGLVWHLYELPSGEEGES